MPLKRKATYWIAVVAAVLGLACSMAFVKGERRLFDADEAAWIFNGYYLDLYLSGDLKNPAWREFDRYAQHPPAAAYLFGAMLHAIGEPMKSMEPRRFWFENDLKIVQSSKWFTERLIERLAYKQVLAGRYMSAFFAWLSAVVLMLLAMRLVGTFGGVVGFFVLIFHPTFRGMATLAVGDTFIVFLSALSVYLAVEISLRYPASLKRAWGLAAALALVLGINFASKISSYAMIAMVFIPVIILSGDKKSLRFNLAIVAASVVAALCVAYVLDPGLYGSPVSTTIDRIAWRADRIGIQRIIFADQSFDLYSERLAFIIYYLFLSNFVAFLFFLLSMAGLAFSIFMRGDVRRARIVLFFASYALFLTAVLTPMAWTRYVVAYLPFLVLLAAFGSERVKDMILEWGSISTWKRAAIVLISAVVLLASLGLRHYLAPVHMHLPRISDGEERALARRLASCILYPGMNEDILAHLLTYYRTINHGEISDYQGRVLEKIRVRKR